MTWRERTVPHGPEATRPTTSCRTSPAHGHAQCRGDVRVAVTQRAAYAETVVVLTTEGHADQVYEPGGDDARNFETVAAAFAEAPSPVSSAVRLLPWCRCSSHSPEPRRPSGSRPGVGTCFTHRPGWDAGDDGVGGTSHRARSSNACGLSVVGPVHRAWSGRSPSSWTWAGSGAGGPSRRCRGQEERPAPRPPTTPACGLATELAMTSVCS
jgi:hypothetical protein